MLTTGAVAQWQPTGPYAKTVRAIIQAPDNPSVFFAGAFGWGVFKSTDAGSTWTNLQAGLSNTYVRSLAARSAQVLLCGTNDNIARSSDGGATWTVVQPTAFSVRGLSYDPATGHWYAGTYGDDYYASTDDGINWTKHIVHDPVSGQTLSHIRAVSCFGADSVYVGGSIGDIASGLGGALFATYDGGMNWNQIQKASPAVRSSVTDISVSPNVPATSLIFGTAIKGMYKTTDGGVSLTNINAGGLPAPLGDTSVSATAFSAAFRIAATDSVCGVFLRALGDTLFGWETATGLPNAPYTPWALASYGNGSGLLVGLEQKGTYRSSDSGRTFVAANTGILETDARAFAFTASGRVVVGTGFGDELFYSDNDGATWTHAAAASANSIFGLSRSTTGVLYAAQYATGILKSTDNGTSWIETDSAAINRFVRSVACDPFNASAVYAGTGNGVFKTTDAGTSWIAASGGVIPFSTSIRSLGVSPLVSGLVLAGTDVDFLYRSTNGGTNWTHLDSTAGFLPHDAFVRSITFDPLLSSRVYIGSDSGHVYKSEDGGSSFSLLANLPGSNSVRAIEIDPANSSRIFAATFGTGVFVTEDAGVNWVSYNTGLADLQVSALALRPASSPLELWAGSGHRGAYRTTYSGLPASLLGDVNMDGVITSADIIYSVNFVFKGGPAPKPTAAVGDVNCDLTVTASDIIFLVNYVFKGGAAPAC